MRLVFFTENLIRDSLIHITNGSEIHECIRLELSKDLCYIDLPDCEKSSLTLRISSTCDGMENRKVEILHDDVLKNIVFKYMKDIDHDSFSIDSETSKEKKNDRVRFSDYAGVIDVLGYQQAYETVIDNIEEDVEELYCGFFSLGVLNGTVIKAVALRKKGVNQIENRYLEQCFRRVPKLDEIERRFASKRRVFFIKAVATVLFLAIGWYLTTTYLHPVPLVKYAVLFLGGDIVNIS